ncbi:acetyl-CoA carboxylase biotin carboxyl carrier protein [Streptococcus caprae]|uniref:Biotin carboxyl carrier protein of acetyl-CoA carboxylase n=1 Tax=Streptococcus caprae TaxID=1640501 RepID=A0ABV8CX72_9STRE
MNISEIKELLAQFDQSSLREFSYKNGTDELKFSKNEHQAPEFPPVPHFAHPAPVSAEVPAVQATAPIATDAPTATESGQAEGEVVESPLVGVAYLSPSPDKPAFVAVGDSVKKGQTLLIIEAMKVMNEVPSPRDGVVTEILVNNEDMIEYGKGLVRIK